MDKIVLFIPMYNCENQITRVLSQLTQEVCSFLSELIIVNNRSTDQGENRVIEYLNEHSIPIKVTLLRNEENYGLGGSHKVAFDYAVQGNFDYLIVLHGDDQGDISNILPYLRNREYEKYDCFLGARFMKGSKLQGYSTFRSLGNRVFNMFFSLGAGKRIYDLGSGLNMYRVSCLKDRYYLKFRDNLSFNCYMLLSSIYMKHRMRFFPIVWREDDQVSNVKMVSQALGTLKMLAGYVGHKSSFLQTEHRDKPVEQYLAKKVYANRKLHLVMPMGGGGTRFGNKGFQVPKPLIELRGKPFFFWAVQSIVKFVDVLDLTFVVLQEHIERFQIDERIREYYPDARICVIPEVLRGAVLTCCEGIKRIEDDCPILFNDCDHAFLCRRFYEYCQTTDMADADGALLTFESQSPNYSYVKFGNKGEVVGTIEKQVVSNEAICGAYYFKNTKVFMNAVEDYLKQCEYQEFFISGVYNEMTKRGEKIITFPVDEHISFGTPEEYDLAVCDKRLEALE